MQGGARGQTLQRRHRTLDSSWPRRLLPQPRKTMRFAVPETGLRVHIRLIRTYYIFVLYINEVNSFEHESYRAGAAAAVGIDCLRSGRTSIVKQNQKSPPGR